MYPVQCSYTKACAALLLILSTGCETTERGQEVRRLADICYERVIVQGYRACPAFMTDYCLSVRLRCRAWGKQVYDIRHPEPQV